MPFEYETNPQIIEQQSFKKIRQLTNLDGLDETQQQVIMRIVHSVGLPSIAKHVRFSEKACESGLKAIEQQRPIFCDVEMVKQGITKRMLSVEPGCYLNEQSVTKLAKQTGETRTMAALTFWRENLEGAIVVIGNAPTALFRLLEMIEEGAGKPGLIIGMPVGFIGAAESKQALWENHKKLNIECITLLGQQGGSAVSCATLNALLRCHINEYY
ncbi:precorrin-8X methylmutase [Aliikangiella sp. IMCC44359]|uniref:precorrin-8X methylmutase n=1 Tax=Aliikangiella sp. IMCC44359 TaxID=3459125 RepID=UPI00403B1421